MLKETRETTLFFCPSAFLVLGENYGGVGDAYLAWADGSLTVKVNQKVAEEVAWNPTKDEFILIEGKSPSGKFCGYILILV